MAELCSRGPSCGAPWRRKNTRRILMASSVRPIRLRSKSVILTGLLSAILASGCGSSKSPAAPSESAPPASTGSTASISGRVQSAPSGLSVSVVGTPLAATTDSGGNFALGGVPAGDVQLKFSGSGADATVPITEVQPAQNITLLVTVSGTSASVETEMRSGAGEVELEAKIDALPPTTAAGTFTAAGRTVKTDSSTTFEQQGNTRTFADLTVGLRVHVKGTPSGSDILARRIQMQSPNSGPSNPAPPSAPTPGNKEVEAA